MAKAMHTGLPEAGQGGTVSDKTLRSLAGYNMKRAFNVVQADLARTLEPFGLRMITFTALVLVVDNPDMSQTQLAGALAVERSNLVVIIDDLEQAGLITRNPSPTDRRSHALRVTLAGRRLCERAMRAVRAHEEKLLGGLDEGGAATLIAALQVVEHGNTGGEE